MNQFVNKTILNQSVKVVSLPDYLSNDAATNLGLGNDFLFIILLILLSSEFITSTASSPFTYINVC